MKAKTILFTVIALLFLAGGAGCEKEKRVPNELIGSWKCLGFGNAETNSFKDIEPKDCEKCYTLTFKPDGTFTGYTSANEAGGNFNIDISSEKINLKFGVMTYVNEHIDGHRYIENIAQVISFNFIMEDKLHLFYKNNEYLLFKRTKK